MATPILKRRLNPLLLISTVAALSLLAGVAVISQDQIASAQEQKQDVEQELQDKEQRIEELRTEIQNKTAKIRQIRGNSSELQTRIEEMDSELQNKTDTIDDLRDQLDEQRKDLNQSDTINSINSSLQTVCYVESTEDNLLAESEDECNEWGHLVNKDES